MGSTGSIGQQALDVIRQFPDEFKVIGLAAGKNRQQLAAQIKEIHPQIVALKDERAALDLTRQLTAPKPEVYWGEEGLKILAGHPEAKIVLNALAGLTGLMPTVVALKAGKNVALANKETLVAAGQAITSLVKKTKTLILPVDSEHSAIWQCLAGNPDQTAAKIILTASGGPFRCEPADLSKVTVEMALTHPTWQMGRKVTIDAATLMNKGLEVIEAHFLFGLGYDQIQVVIHPQSIIHSMVEYVDGAVIAQLSVPDMRMPIQYAFSYPQRWSNRLPRVDWFTLKEITFEPPDIKRFPCLSLAFTAGKTGGTLPAVLNAANEIAVEAFLNRSLNFSLIPEIVERVMEAHQVISKPDLEEIITADQWARKKAWALISKFEVRNSKFEKMER